MNNLCRAYPFFRVIFLTGTILGGIAGSGLQGQQLHLMASDPENNSALTGQGPEQEHLPGGTLDAATGQDTAVEDITNRPFMLGDLFTRGSPLHVGLTVGETYDDNIFLSHVKTSDLITHVSPAVDLELGDRTAAHSHYFNLYFSPSLFFYAQNSQENRQDYDANAYYQYQWTRLTLGIGQHYQHLTDPSIDIGNFANRDIYTTAVNGSYVFNDKLTLFADASQTITQYQTGSDIDTNEWRVEGYALYQVTPKLSLGAGPAATFIDITGAPNEEHQDFLVRANYNPGGKITGSLTAGIEYLQYQSNIDPSHLLPIFNLNASYAPGDKTTLTFTASRQTLISYDLSGETYVTTTASASVRQQILRDVYGLLSASYNLADYDFGSEQVEGPRRKDDYYAISAGLEWDPRPWLKTTVSYQYSNDDSSLIENSFTDNQINIQAQASF